MYRRGLTRISTAEMVALIGVIMAAAPSTASAQRLEVDVAARLQSFKEDRERFSNAPRPSDLTRSCASDDTAGRRECIQSLMFWGDAAFSLEIPDAAIAYYYEAMKFSYAFEEMRFETALAWAHWSLGLREKYLLRDMFESTEAQRAAAELNDARLSPGYTTPDQTLRVVYDAIKSEKLFFLQGFGADEIVEMKDLSDRLRQFVEISLTAWNARTLVAKGDLDSASAQLKNLADRCGGSDFALSGCMEAAYTGVVLSFYSGRNTETWRLRLLRSLEAFDTSDRRIVFVLAALGLSDFVAGRRERGTAYFESAMTYASSIEMAYDRELNRILSTYASMLADTGDYESALTVSALTASSSGFLEQGSRYAKLLSQIRLGNEVSDSGLEDYIICDKYWAVKTCLLMWDYYFSKMINVRSEDGRLLLNIFNQAKSLDDFKSIRATIPTPTLEEFYEARGSLDSIVSLMNETRFPVDQVPTLKATYALRIGSYRLAEDRTEEALASLLTAKQTVQENGLELETTSIDTDLLLSQIHLDKECIAAAFQASDHAVESIIARQRNHTDYNLAAENEIRRYAPAIRAHVALAFQLSHETQTRDSCEPLA